MPATGVRGVWNDEGESFFFSSRVVTELTRMNALTLYSFWKPSVSRWTTAEELAEEGVDKTLANEIARHLTSSLLPKVRDAMATNWVVQTGDWCVDLWGTEGDAVYDSIIRDTKFVEDDDSVLGVEYVLPTPEHDAGRLSKV